MTGEEIQEIRKKLGVSQERFAALLGTTCVSVNRWENNKTKPSRLYAREIKNLERDSGLYTCRHKELKNT